jgi:hypothetical protein
MKVFPPENFVNLSIFYPSLQARNHEKHQRIIRKFPQVHCLSAKSTKKKKADFPTCVKIGKTTREHRFLLANCLTDPGIRTTEENQENHKRTSILAKKIVLNC